jgi:hypothetical protein
MNTFCEWSLFNTANALLVGNTLVMMILVVFILYSDGWLVVDDIHCFFDEDLRDWGNDCIAVTAQSSHAGGSPMSQRGCAGFNWPPLSIAAKEPVSISPETVIRAGPSCVDQPAIAAVADISIVSPL